MKATMKLVFLAILLALGLQAPVIAQTDLFTALAEENACLVTSVYGQSGTAATNSAHQRQALETCVTPDKGTGAWYRQDRAARQYPVEPASPEMQTTLASFKKAAANFLGGALARCEVAQADLSQCLALLKLPARGLN